MVFLMLKHVRLRITPRVGSALTALAVLFFLAACSNFSQPPVMASDFQVTLFTGEDFRLSDQLGKKSVVLNFWYPSCPPCRAEMPAFQAAWEQVQEEGEDVVFLGLFVPRGFDSEQDARDFVQETGLTYDFGTDAGGMVTQDYKLEYFPKTFFIDKTGKVFSSMISALEAEDIMLKVRAMGQS
ncbi:MAG: hypothetical protein BZY80_03105 [SAR202 cluster bacterium Io17-Chloro-G2]|nr:MAG: hypothetical protein BZY80_03105 [SAR202 cluster bacterium Io17-Chloro-G2]